MVSAVGFKEGGGELFRRDGGMGAGSLCFWLWGVDLSRMGLEVRASFVERHRERMWAFRTDFGRE